MLPAHKILLRYKILDKCFRSSEKWTLAMLVKHCSEELKEKVSKRSIQSDIQFLRDNGAPIIIIEKKHYAYEDKSYSILENKVPAKFEEQYKECTDFIDELNTFNLHSSEKPFSTTTIPSLTLAEKYKDHDYVKLQKSQFESLGPRAFLVEATYNLTQKPKDYEQVLKLPMQKRQIPKNLTLWGYPTEEKHEKPNKEELYKYTFAVQLFLKNVKCNTGALQVIQGSHQRELSPLEINLIAQNTHPVHCDVEKGGFIVYSPLLIQKIAPSESPKNKQSITLWFSSYQLPVHYIWNNHITI